MKTDLSKPIEDCYDGSHAEYIRDTPDGKHIIEWQHKPGVWLADAFADWAVDAYFKNTPPEPRKVKVWVAWPPSGVYRDAFPVTDIHYWEKKGYRVTEHEIEEPTP